ncbi:MAG TPA: YwiC-like family protein [Candidatus Acidoferrales bacterium]|nr:YwiC-like family protein [Candidatus Acidoferrales bacterium]
MKLNDLLPREHGTWAMWIVPMLSAALVTHLSASFVLLFTCFALFYIAHRPIAALTKDMRRPELKKFLLIIVPLAIFLAILLVEVYRLPWLILFWGIELSLFAFSVRTFLHKAQRSFINELTVLAALTLSAPAAYYTVTGRVDVMAVWLFILNFLFFGSSVFYVKARIEFLRSNGKWLNGARKSLTMVIAYHIILIAVIVLLGIFSSIDILILLGFTPMMVQVASGILSKDTRVNFRLVGVLLIAQSFAFLVGIKLFLK